MVRLNSGYLTAQMSRTIGVVVAAAAASAAIAPASAAGSVFTATIARPSIEVGGAAAGTHYGGSALYKGNRMMNPTLGVVVRPNGKIIGRAGMAITCHGSWNPFYVRLSGAAQGATITASGKSRVPGAGYVRVSLTGTADGQTATGKVTVREPGRCRHWSGSFVLHTGVAPAGPPAMPAPRTAMTGVTAQTAGGVHLPISLSITHTGKVWGQWDASLNCGPGTYHISNLTPLTKIRTDATFTRKERYTIRYKGGYTNHYTVRLTGAFHSDGVSGTLTARVRTTKPGARYRPCASGTQAWWAR